MWGAFLNPERPFGISDEFLLNLSAEAVGVIVDVILISMIVNWISVRRERTLLQRGREWLLRMIVDDLARLVSADSDTAAQEHYDRLMRRIERADSLIPIEGRHIAYHFAEYISAARHQGFDQYTSSIIVEAFSRLLDTLYIRGNKKRSLVFILSGHFSRSFLPAQ